jgi:GNAT superfamily N-acetyltransferase
MSSATISARRTDSARGPAIVQREEVFRLLTDCARLTAPLNLRDGTTVTMRAIRPDDTERLRAFHAQLWLESVYLRFITQLPELPLELAERLTHLDYDSRMALVATSGAGDDERIIGVVRDESAGPTVGEVAFAVTDDWQGHSITLALLLRLAEYARRRGFAKLMAQTPGWNTRMHALLRHCGFPVVSYRADGMTMVWLDISESPVPACAH